MLPMGGDERQGDGMLRLQARSGFGKGRGCFQMDHPMIGWESTGSMDEGVDGECLFDDECGWMSMRVVGRCSLGSIKTRVESA